MHDFSTRRGEKLIRCICECVFNTVEGNISLPSDDPKKSVKQIQNAATAHRGKIGRKESYWCSEADFYLILSILSLITEGIKR